MRTMNNKLSIKLAAAGLIATAAFATPAAFAGDHRGQDRGHVEYRGHSHDNRHDGRHDNRDRDYRHDDRNAYRHDYRNDHVRTQTRVVHDTRVVYRDARPAFYRGHTVPVSYRRDIRPLPAAYRYRVPVVPRGYAVGYYQGYSVVYDPTTYLIASVINLLAYQ